MARPAVLPVTKRRFRLDGRIPPLTVQSPQPRCRLAERNSGLVAVLLARRSELDRIIVLLFPVSRFCRPPAGVFGNRYFRRLLTGETRRFAVACGWTGRRSGSALSDLML